MLEKSILVYFWVRNPNLEKKSEFRMSISKVFDFPMESLLRSFIFFILNIFFCILFSKKGIYQSETALIKSRSNENLTLTIDIVLNFEHLSEKRDISNGQYAY